MSGRPSDYSQEKQDIADDYLVGYSAHGDKVPQVAGLAKLCGVCERTIYNWGDTHPAFLQTLSQIQTEQHRTLVNNGLDGTFSAPIAKLMMANHGHSEKTQTDITSNGKEIKNDWHIHPVTTDKS